MERWRHASMTIVRIAALLALFVELAATRPARAAARCDATASDAEAVSAARRAIDASCPCDGFASHAEYGRCARAVLAVQRGAGLLDRACANLVRRTTKRSTCSHTSPRIACCEENLRSGARHCRIRSADECVASARTQRTTCASSPFCADTRCGPEALGGSASDPACDGEVLYSAEGNRLRRFDIDSVLAGPLVEDVLIPSADDDIAGRDINGQICPLGDGSGRFVAGEDTDQPHPPPGWGVFEADGTQVGKLTATYFTSGAEPFGCAVDADGRLFTSEVGNQAAGDFNGQLILWFPPYDRFPGPPGAYPATDEPSTNFCKLAVDVGTAGSVAVDERGNVYVASARGFQVLRFAPPFPTGPDAGGGCGATDGLGSPFASSVQRSVFADAVTTASGIVRAQSGTWFLGSVFTGTIGEYDAGGTLLRTVLQPASGETTYPLSVGHPQGLARDCHGNLYYADLALVVSGGGIGPGPNGTVRRIGFDVCGEPEPPVVVRDGLAFPDGLGIFPGDLATAP
jgi:hypothetical protein